MKKIVKMFSFIFATFLFFGVTNVNAAEDDIIKRIAPDGVNAILKTVKPTSADESDILLSSIFTKMVNEENYMITARCDEPGFTSCTVNIQGMPGTSEEAFSESYAINVTYDVPTSNSVIENYISKIKEFSMSDLTTFYKVEDLGLINYYMTSTKSELWYPNAAGRVLKYSDEIIKLTNGSNVSFSMDFRMGTQDESLMYESAIGGMNIYYNDYCYGTRQHGMHLRRVLYIPSDTEETKEAYMAAAKARVDAYLGEGNGITITYGGLLSSLEDGATDSTVETEATDGNYYYITVKEKAYKFYIIKGTNEQLVAPTYLGSHISTNVAITSGDSSVPLDTLLTVNDVKNDNIKNVLGSDDYKAFDIKLYSDVKGAYVEKLDNGKFLVKIPVPTEYEGKELFIYYINTKNETEEHNVTVQNGFASFETNHFSTYILTPVSNVVDAENPETGDNLPLYIIFGAMSLIGLIGCGIYLNKEMKAN